MLIKIYPVPTFYGNGIALAPECVIEELGLVVGMGGSYLLETPDKYSELEVIKEFEVPDENKEIFTKLRDILVSKNVAEESVMNYLESFIQEAIKEVKDTPHIQIANQADVAAIEEQRRIIF